MSSYSCPFCGITFSISADTSVRYFLPKTHASAIVEQYTRERLTDEQVLFSFYTCPSCNRTSISAIRDSEYEPFATMVYPRSKHVVFPDYVPSSIRQDYIEACAVVADSPKAAATLCRRCLQGMIRDFWGISESTLNKELDELKGKISDRQWSAIDALRRIGNIGAHMESDVNLIIDIDPDEAQKLIKLVEYLIRAWYVETHDEQVLIDEILSIDHAAQAKRHPL